ncbi:hypothetical protein FRY74_07840 [Vicingus serpentipes]|jgi:hypothetical protein|uniref:Gliding motility-associated C-terminal domain-containing protein n=1 Tax=Vicingus serpentipes TaxID=1926625 RepID=A0A5C6RTM7_9FLAO|nr:hypothetical protein [Vicingus serpentipes]TXB65324.1 hypothetical protein FRY74_07840 [Vicingus serpentipes]
MKLFLILLFTTIFSIRSYCSDPTTINFCANTSNTIALTDLLNCNELVVSNATFSVQTLKIGFTVNGNYYEQTITGNTIPQTFINNIQTYQPNLLYIEDIVLIDSNNQEKNLKPIKIKVSN